MDPKYNPETERKVLDWIQTITGEDSSGISGLSATHEYLKSGVILCKLMNRIQPGSVGKINESKRASKQKENIGKFVDAVIAYGFSKHDLFQTVDLYEGQNMPQVINGIDVLRRTSMSKGVIGIGPKPRGEKAGP